MFKVEKERGYNKYKYGGNILMNNKEHNFYMGELASCTTPQRRTIAHS